MTYARGTSVAVSRSKAELERVLDRYGADERMVAESRAQSLAFVAFTLGGRNIKVELPLPRREGFRLRMYRGREVEADEEWQAKAWEQSCRERWRVFVLTVKAKLELIEVGASTVDREFLASVMLPGGATIGERLIAQLDELEELPLLMAPGGGS